MNILHGDSLQSLIGLRRHLHRFPELSDQEANTARYLSKFVLKFHPHSLIDNIGGNGFAAVWEGQTPGPTVILRAELDALPIAETNHFDHRSEVPSVSHKCGHDGHMATLAGVAALLAERPPKRGKAVLFFQPAEETGQGAARCIADPKFRPIWPDYAFALHNLPGHELGKVLIRSGTFAAASKGVIVELEGASSHAATPEKGNSPANAMAHIMLAAPKLAAQKDRFEDYCNATVIHARLGEVAFGTTPGNGVVMATLRANVNEDMKKLESDLERLVCDLCAQLRLKHRLTRTEEFPATVNHPKAVELVRQSCHRAGIQSSLFQTPFRWSEDFGHFSTICPCALFGLGAGESNPPLHNEDYDYPDEIIPTGIRVYAELVEVLLNHG